jgi:hypothetical protein
MHYVFRSYASFRELVTGIQQRCDFCLLIRSVLTENGEDRERFASLFGHDTLSRSDISINCSHDADLRTIKLICSGTMSGADGTESRWHREVTLQGFEGDLKHVSSDSCVPDMFYRYISA